MDSVPKSSLFWKSSTLERLHVDSNRRGWFLLQMVKHFPTLWRPQFLAEEAEIWYGGQVCVGLCVCECMNVCRNNTADYGVNSSEDLFASGLYNQVFDLEKVYNLCICVQSFISGHLMRNYDTFYCIQIKCFLTKHQSFCHQMFNQNPHRHHVRILMLFVLFLKKKCFDKMLFFSLKPFSYQINKT